MYNIKPGNDLTIRWALFHTDGTPFPLVNYEYRLFYSTIRGKSEETESGTLSVDGNILTWVFSGSKQTTQGEYELQLKVMFNGRTIATLRRSSAFMLSSNGIDNPIGLTLDLMSYCDYIAIQDAVQQARHAVDEAAAVANTSIEIEGVTTLLPTQDASAEWEWNPDTHKLTIRFGIPKGRKGDKGDQGNTGSSVRYPFEIVNNLTTDDATKALSAAMGKRLQDLLGPPITEEEYKALAEAGELEDRYYFVEEEL